MNTTKTILLVIGILIFSAVGFAQVFTGEESARAFKDSFTDYPEKRAEANITRISSLLDNNYVVIEWEMKVLNTRDNKNKILRSSFSIPKGQINNNTLIENSLEVNVKREFNSYNESFVPNPIIEYRSHSLWGKTIGIILD